MPIYTASGGLSFGGSSPVASSRWSYVASGGLKFGSVAPAKVTYSYTSSGGLKFGGVAPAKVTYSYTSSGGLKFGGVAPAKVTYSYTSSGRLKFGGVAPAKVTYSYTSSGGLKFGGVAPAKVTYSYTSSGGLKFGGVAPLITMYNYAASGGLKFGSVATAKVTYSYTSSGGLKFGSVATAKVTYSYTSSGGLKFGGVAPFVVSSDIITTFTWDVSEGVLRNWRVLGKCLPSNHICPPTNVKDNGCPPNHGNTMRFMMNVQAHSVTDLCQKLKNKGWVSPISKIQVWSQPVRKSDWGSSVDPTCNTLTTVDFSGVASCFDYLVDQNLSVTSAVSARLIFESNFSYVASGRLGTGGSSRVVSNYYSYAASGSLKNLGSSRSFSPQYYHYTASGGLGVRGTATYRSNYYGVLSSSASASAAVLNLGIIFGVQPATVLTASTTTVAGGCCAVKTLPQILFMKHDLNRSDELSNFLMVNGLTLPNVATLMYSKSRNSWYSNTQLHGMSIDNQLEQQVWNVVLEFGCLLESGLFDVPPQVWGFSILLRRKSLSSSRLETTRLVLEFDPAQVCTITGSLKFDFSFNTNSMTTTPAVVRTAVFLDELNSFNGISYKINPNASFEVSSSPPVVSSGMFDQSMPLKNVLLSV